MEMPQADVHDLRQAIVGCASVSFEGHRGVLVAQAMLGQRVFAHQMCERIIDLKGVGRSRRRRLFIE